MQSKSGLIHIRLGSPAVLYKHMLISTFALYAGRLKVFGIVQIASELVLRTIVNLVQIQHSASTHWKEATRRSSGIKRGINVSSDD